MRALLCHNPSAGDGSHKQDELLAALSAAGISATYCSTKGPDFPEALKKPTDLIIAAGGDGTVAKVLKKMPDRSIPVTILPLGTANNIARSLGIEGTVKQLAAKLKQARKQRFDIGLSCGPWGRRLFVEAVGLGSLTEAMSRIDAVKIERADGVKLGRDTFRKVLGEAKPIKLGLSVDGRSHDDELLLVEVMNIPYAGPGIALTPDNGIGDGLFDVVCIRPDQRQDMMAWLGASEPNVPAPVTIHQGRKISLTWEGSPVRLDDDCPSGPNRGDRVTVECESDPVTILIPDIGKKGPQQGRSRRSKAS